MHPSILIGSLNLGYQLMYLSFTLCGKQQNLQHAQNFAARIIIRSCKFDHITPVLGELITATCRTHACLQGWHTGYFAKKIEIRGARFSKVRITFRARNKIFQSKYKE